MLCFYWLVSYKDYIGSTLGKGGRWGGGEKNHYMRINSLKSTERTGVAISWWRCLHPGFSHIWNYLSMDFSVRSVWVFDTCQKKVLVLQHTQKRIPFITCNKTSKNPFSCFSVSLSVIQNGSCAKFLVSLSQISQKLLLNSHHSKLRSVFVFLTLILKTFLALFLPSFLPEKQNLAEFCG